MDADDLGFDAHVHIEARPQALGRLHQHAILLGSFTRSNMMISQFSHKRRERVAALTPPATPPRIFRRLLLVLSIYR